MILAVVANSLGLLPGKRAARPARAAAGRRSRPARRPRPVPGAGDTANDESARILLMVTWSALF
jgi:hypothetical protein